MKKKVISLIFVMVLILIALGNFIKQQIDDNNTLGEETVNYEMDLKKVGLEQGQIAPDFTLQTLTGDSISLSQYKGQKVILNFWATWCPPCKKEFPQLQNYYEKYAKEDHVEVVGVNFTYKDGSTEQIQKFIDSYKITFPIPLLETKGVDDLYQVLTIPSTIIIDTEGRIQYYTVGALDVKTLREYILKIE